MQTSTDSGSNSPKNGGPLRKMSWSSLSSSKSVHFDREVEVIDFEVLPEHPDSFKLTS
jgi:hypothetical protein